MKNYIGLDAHSATSTFVNMDKDGKIHARCTVKTSEANLIGFLRAQKGEKKLTLEQSGLSKWLHVILKDEVDELIVCNPVYISKRSGPKNDYRDAHHLADELQGRTLYKSPERIGELSKPTDRFIGENLMKQLTFLEEVKQKYLGEFRENMKRYPVLRNIDSIPGIDVIRAHFIAAYICSPYRFENKHKLWAYAMLVKYNQESDGKIYGRKRIHGCTELKNVFIGAAGSVLKGNSAMRKLYDRLRSKGLDDGCARYDVARKRVAGHLPLVSNIAMARWFSLKNPGAPTGN